MKKKIFFKGPLLTRSGYGEQSRFALRALRSRPDLFDMYIQPLQWGKTSWIVEMDEERAWIDQSIEKTIAYTQQGGTYDASFQVTIPNEWEKHAPVNIGFTAGIETTKVALPWIQKGNDMDRIIVVSNHSKSIYENTVYVGNDSQTEEEVRLTLQTPVDVVNYPVKTFEPMEIDLQLEHPFNLLCVAQYGPRKNLDNTIRWFIEEFRSEPAGLVIKANIAKNCLADRRQLFYRLKHQIAELGEKKCSVYLLHGDMTDQEMHSLYAHEKIAGLISLSHGEGFGLPLYEAAYSGVPVITVGWSGQNDFLVDQESGNHEFYNVEYDLAPIPEQVVWEGVLIKESQWAYAREHSVRQQMRKFYYDYTHQNKETLARFAKDAKRIRETFSPERQNELMVNSLCEALQSPIETLGSGPFGADPPLLEFG